MNQDQYVRTTSAMFANAPAGSGTFGDIAFYTNDGTLSIATDTGGKLGFGIASGITPTAEVLSVVGDLNRLMTFGHYWLAPGADEQNYSIICGFKFPYGITQLDYVAEVASATVKYSASLVSAARQQLESVAHRQYWLDDVEAGPQAFVLISQLS